MGLIAQVGGKQTPTLTPSAADPVFLSLGGGGIAAQTFSWIRRAQGDRSDHSQVLFGVSVRH